MKFKRIHYLTRGQLYSDFVRWYTCGVRTCESTGGIVLENIDSATRNAIWYTLCDLEWHARYCSAMADRCHGLHKAVRFAILAGVAFEGIVLYGATINPWLFSLGIAGGLVLACLTIWDATSDYATNAATFRMVTIICQRLRNEADVLWRDVEARRQTADQAENTLRSIREQWVAATQSIPLRTNNKLNIRATKAADKEIVGRYGAQLPNV